MWRNRKRFERMRRQKNLRKLEKDFKAAEVAAMLQGYGTVTEWVAYTGVDIDPLMGQRLDPADE